MGINPTFAFGKYLILSYFKIQETTKNLNQVGRPRDLNPGPPEYESRALPVCRLHNRVFLDHPVVCVSSF